ncbi:MAG TPA: hypothetical protein PLI45_00950 [Candidatus Woesebacteria bacterium]|nr:hypothetical protein [Candidatus Woesebacteria bacterium]
MVTKHLISKIEYENASRQLDILKKEQESIGLRIVHELDEIKDKKYLLYLCLKMRKKQQGIRQCEMTVRLYLRQKRISHST